MARKRSMSLAALAIGALVGALGVVGTSAAPPVRADATAVIHWNEVAVNTLAAIPGPNGGAPPALQINMGMVEGAVYDAVNAIGPKQHRPYLLKRRFGAKASIDAAVATAAYDVLTDIVSNAGPALPVPGSAPGLLDNPRHGVRELRSLRSTPARSNGRASTPAMRPPQRCSRHEWTTAGSGHLSGSRTPPPGTGSRSSTLLPGSRSSTRPRGWAG